MPFSISAAVRFIALFVIAILDGVVMVSYMEERRRDGLAADSTPGLEAKQVRGAAGITATTDFDPQQALDISPIFLDPALWEASRLAV